MNITKIQQDLLKDALTERGGNWFVSVNDSEVVIFTKYQVYVIAPSEWMLDTNSLIGKGVKTSTAAETILNKSDEAKLAVKTGVMRQFDKRTLLELKCGEELIYLDQALLKYYDKSAEFEATSKVAPVYIYEDDILVGCALPVKV